jgi:hypothetical protein
MALFALAHEAVHLLSPAYPKERAPMLEEGIATNYSAEVGARFGVEFDEHDGAYIFAKERTRPFLDQYSNAVREIRRRHPDFDFGSFTPELISAACPGGIDRELAEDLCEPFWKVEQRLGGPKRD